MANLFIVTLMMLLQVVTCRKSYIIKEKIESGEMKVMQPRVKTTKVEWCWSTGVDRCRFVSGAA